MEYTAPDGWPHVIQDLEYFYAHHRTPNHWLWSHVEDMKEVGGHVFHGDAATEVMVSLLNSPWIRCDELEVAMVDYMVFWEIHVLLEQIKGSFGSRWFPRRARKTRAALGDLGGKMLWAYNTLRPSQVFSPFQIRAALLHAQDAGAAWKPAVFAMLDCAAKRDQPLWFVP
jgi:hypothetical protein